MSLRTILYLSRNVGLSKRFFVDGLKLKVRMVRGVGERSRGGGRGGRSPIVDVVLPM